MLQHDWSKYGELHPFANHLHQHDHGTEMWTSHLRGKVGAGAGGSRAKVGEYGRFTRYGGGAPGSVAGLGQGETFMDLTGPRAAALPDKYAVHPGTAGLSLKPGDNVRVNCVIDTKRRNIWDHAAKETVRYGMFTGLEMCGILMMYYPHDSARQFQHGSLIADSLDLTARRTCFDWESTGGGATTGKCVKRWGEGAGHTLEREAANMERAVLRRMNDDSNVHNARVAAAVKDMRKHKWFDVGGACPGTDEGEVCEI